MAGEARIAGRERAASSREHWSLWLPGLAAVVVTAVLAAPVTGAEAARQGGQALPRDGRGIDVRAGEWLNRRTLELTVSSPTLLRSAGVRILVPPGYRTHRRTHYPVLYLLHGGYGTFRDWTDAGSAKRLTKRRRLIVVMPDGGQGGWYRDWDNFGAGGPPKWETFHLRRLVPWVDARFRTLARRRARAIAGLSMGGFGAVSYAGRNPDLFAAVASFSGAVDTRNPLLRDLIHVSPLVDGGTPGAIYPPPEVDEESWQDHNPWDLAPELHRMHVALHTGNGEPGPFDDPGAPADVQETAVHSMNLAVHERLLELGIDHTWLEGPGTHTWPYWRRGLRLELPAIMRTLADPRAVRAGRH